MLNKLLIIVVVLLATSSALYPSSSKVIELTSQNFENLVLHSNNIWLVKFFAPWCSYCQAFVPEYSKTAAALEGIIKVGAINIDQHQDIGKRYDIKSLPTIKIFDDGKNRPEDIHGANTARFLVGAALEAAKAKIEARLRGGNNRSDAVELTDDNFDKTVLEDDNMWLVEFFAPWCPHCQNFAPHWAKAITILKGKVKLGTLDVAAHQEQAKKYKVQKLPTIKFFPAGKKSNSMNYDGEATASGIINWALDKIAQNLPPPDIFQIVNNDTFSKSCEDQKLCVVAIVPHILDCQSECRNSYLKVLRQLAEKYKKRMWGWIWSEAGAQLDLENLLQIGGFGYPAMAAISIRKMKYSTLRGAFSYDGINEFLRDIAYGRGVINPEEFHKMPKILSVEAWDGKDKELPQEEEEEEDIGLKKKDEL